MGIFRDRSLLKTPLEKPEEIAQSNKSDSPPPDYRLDQLPEEDLVASVRALNLTKTTTADPTSLPTNDECIAHLKLLAALANLREEVAETDGIFGINDSLADYLTDENGRHEQAIVKIREKRWAVYVARAVDRFHEWWETCLPSAHFGTGEGGRFSMQDVLESRVHSGGTFEKVVLQAHPMSWKTAMLPPLDVLMVLHSFMLNPRVFLEDCIRHGKLPLWHAGFPWALVNESINNMTFEYRTPHEAVQAFESGCGLSWDNLQDVPEKTITCPNCTKPVQCPYTKTASFSFINPFENSIGYADKSFQASCKSCSTQIVHESLRLRKFRQDMQLLMKYNIPMPGTILSLNGVPAPASSTSDPTKHETFFPNRLILAGLYNDLMDQTDPSYAYDFDRVRKSIERGLRDRGLVTKANKNVVSKALKRGEKIAIRRMMSRYWENSSPLALDLVGAVLRQGVFVEKMKALDWIRSPALESTITRLIKKYTVFFQIMAENPGHMAVPTLDVDLAWHTHQLSPAHYAAYAMTRCKGELIDHDDKVEENKLSNAFEWTSKRYQKLTGGLVYSECTCWYCEAIRESHNHQSPISSAETKRAKTAALGLHDRKDAATKNPHISAHNAVKAESRAGERIAARQQYKLERDYEKAVKRACAAGKSPPTRDSYAHTYVWGYPMYMPVYYPYGADPCISGGMYACNPVGINTGYGAAGNCAAGSCGGGVAAGACASASGGCGSAAAGACAGGGGGGGGCGGGGGGGGCGGGGGGGGCGGGGGA